MGDYLQLIAIALPFLIGFAGLIASLRVSAKSRRTSIVSMRRKERLDKLTVYSSKFLTLVHPVSLKTFTIKQNADYINNLLEAFYTFSMHLDSRYEKDVEIIRHFQLLEEESIKYFAEYNQSNVKDELDAKYRELYFSIIDEASVLTKIFISTEWGRLKEEAETGSAVSLERWQELYEKAFEDYMKANFANSDSHT